MVKIGDDFNEKKEKSEKKRFVWEDFGEFLEEYWWGLLIAGAIIFGGIEGIVKAVQPNAPKEVAVIIEVVDEKLDDYKVKFNDGVTKVIDLEDGYVVGDTILTER
jgi:hypothetical protein